MERNTLSHYGWIIVMVLTLSVVLAFATPFGKYVGRGVVSLVQAFRNANDANFDEDHRAELEDRWEQKLEDPDLPPIYDLQQQYKFEYYSKFSLAMSDINNDAIGANADVDKKDAVAGIYTDNNGVVNVVLLKDATETERTSIKKFVILNLGGKTLTYNNAKVGIDVYNGITILGQYKGSGITANGLEYARPVQVRSGVLTINGGTYTNNIQQYPETSNGADAVIYSIGQGNYISNATINANGSNNSALQSGGNITIDNCKFNANVNDGMGIGIFAGGTLNITNSTVDLLITSNQQVTEGTSKAIDSEDETVKLNISDCFITATSQNCIEKTCGIRNSGTLNIKNSTIIQQDNENIDGDSFGPSCGINNVNKATIINCNVKGVISGIMSDGSELNIDGGTYEGSYIGGIFLHSNEETTSDVNANIKNATLKSCNAPYEQNEHTKCKTGLYVSNGFEENYEVNVFVNNCNIQGTGNPIILEDNAVLYISNSNINKDKNIKIYDAEVRIYIGTGCNFTIDNIISTKNSVTEQIPSIVTKTDETYG